MTAKVLIVDDEIDLVRLVRYNLEKEKFHVLSAYDGKTAMSQLEEHGPDLIILDLMLPDISGVKFCQYIKSDPATKKIPVIMLTARSSEDDRVAGFEAGAEDYVIKPFSPKELVLRVKAMLGRTQQASAAPEPTRIDLGEIVIYPAAHTVETHTGETIMLSFLEFKILLYLSKTPNIVRSREQLIAEVWQQEGENISDRTVDTHIKRLRQKLGESREVIETIRGVGYRIIPTKPIRALAG